MFDFFRRLIGQPTVKSARTERKPRSLTGQPRSAGRRIRRNHSGRAVERRSQGPVEPMRIIEEARDRANLTLYGLALLAEMDQTYLRRLLNGQRRSPSRDTLISSGEALIHFDPRFKKKDLDKVLSSAGLLKLQKDWRPRIPTYKYNPRSRAG